MTKKANGYNLVKMQLSMKLFFGAAILIVAITGCSKSISIDGVYRGVTNNPKVLTEGLKLNADNTYIFNYTVFDVGKYASNVEFIGKYEIAKEQIKFSLDTIKSFNSRVYEPNEKRDYTPYTNHRITVVDTEQKETFILGGLRLKPEYSIDKNYKFINESLQERFIVIDILIHKENKLENELIKEIEDLNKSRSTNIKNMVEVISKECNLNESDSFILSVVVKPNGIIDAYEIIDVNSKLRRNEECVENLINREFQNLGELKVIPNARNGSRAKSITYTLPIK